MLYQNAECRVCGKPIIAAQRTVLCSYECEIIARRDSQRLFQWRRLHGDEPYPYPRFRPLPRTCPICGRETRSPSPGATYCRGWCSKVAQSNRMSRFYFAHRDDILARMRAKNASKREVARV